MPNLIQALLIDDVARNHKYTENHLKHPFEALGWQLSWQTATSAEEAREIFARPGAQFDLIVVDLLYERADGIEGYEPVGPELIAAARALYPDAFILALSGGDPHLPDIFEDADRAGANRLLRRDQFSTASREHSPAVVARQIHEHLLGSSERNPITLTHNQADPDLLDLVHTVGKVTLCRLYSHILAESNKSTRTMQIGFIAPGASGAAVCSVQAVLEGSGATVHHLLKVSRDRDALAAEARRGAEAALLVRAALLVKPGPEQPVGPVGGWYAIASQLQRNAATLREWLVDARPALVEDVLVSLFADGLADVYANTMTRVSSPASLLELPHFRQCRIVRAMDELNPVLAHPEGCRLTAAEASQINRLVRLFVLDRRIDAVEQRQLSQETYEVQAHNDLHAANILVYQGQRPMPVIIDPSQFGSAHWAADPARLAVDLLLRSVDAGAQSMFFGRFEAWRQLAADLGRVGATAPTTARDDGTSAPLAAMDWLVGRLRTWCPAIRDDTDYGQHLWEWHTALAVYFLRALYNAAIPAPKRALALVAAYDQLICAAGVIPH